MIQYELEGDNAHNSLATCLCNQNMPGQNRTVHGLWTKTAGMFRKYTLHARRRDMYGHKYCSEAVFWHVEVGLLTDVDPGTCHFLMPYATALHGVGHFLTSRVAEHDTSCSAGSCIFGLQRRRVRIPFESVRSGCGVSGLQHSPSHALCTAGRMRGYSKAPSCRVSFRFLCCAILDQL